MEIEWKSQNLNQTKNYGAKKLGFFSKNDLSNLSEFLMQLIEDLIIDEFFSKLNFQFPNSKISIKSS